jgi:mannitol-1-/sugar-/sorbitol-6-/2-deoxyglucose-6-phosphatase
MIEAVIFDMDGVLIDSEPLWRKAERLVFSKVNIQLTEEINTQTIGLRTDEVVEYWYKKHPWNHMSREEITRDIESTVEHLILTEGQAMEGYREAIRFFLDRGIKTGLASSSHLQLIQTVLKKLDITDLFSVIHSAEFEEFGKPHPGVYLTTAKKLGVSPPNCLAIEDSLNGLKSARAAGMKTIAMPAPFHRNNPEFDMADKLIHSLEEIQPQLIVELS